MGKCGSKTLQVPETVITLGKKRISVAEMANHTRLLCLAYTDVYDDFSAFARGRHADENLLFCEAYRSDNYRSESAAAIIRDFILPGGPHMLNLSESTIKRIVDLYDRGVRDRTVLFGETFSACMSDLSRSSLLNDFFNINPTARSIHDSTMPILLMDAIETGAISFNEIKAAVSYEAAKSAMIYFCFEVAQWKRMTPGSKREARARVLVREFIEPGGLLAVHTDVTTHSNFAGSVAISSTYVACLRRLVQDSAIAALVLSAHKF